MTTKKKTPAQQVDVPTPLVDAYGNPGPVSAGALIESSWGNGVVARVQLRFPNKAAMDAVSAPDGTLALTTDNLGIWFRYGSLWRPTGIFNRLWFRLVGAPGGQTIASGSPTVTAWSAEYDPNGVAPGSVFTVPPGWSGRWSFDWSVYFPDGGQAGTRYAYMDTSQGHRYGETNLGAQEGGTHISTSATIVIAEGGWANIVMYHTDTSGALACNTTADQYFQGYYVGPV